MLFLESLFVIFYPIALSLTRSMPVLMPSSCSEYTRFSVHRLPAYVFA